MGRPRKYDLSTQNKPSSSKPNKKHTTSLKPSEKYRSYPKPSTPSDEEGANSGSGLESPSSVPEDGERCSPSTAHILKLRDEQGIVPMDGSKEQTDNDRADTSRQRRSRYLGKSRRDAQGGWMLIGQSKTEKLFEWFDTHVSMFEVSSLAFEC